MTTTIRLADGGDAEQIAAIYGPIVRDTAISLEVEPPDAREMRGRISKTLARFPWLVCERGGAVLGYAYASLHRVRAAYQWSADVSVYVHAQIRRSGVGQALYSSLFEILVLQGFYNAYAGITLPNPASVGLHEALGFRPVGVYRSVGFKLGSWHDVGWWQLALQARHRNPRTPVKPRTIQKSSAWAQALAVGLPMLRS
jgi:L-amino acid N-acyltransferase YncA